MNKDKKYSQKFKKTYPREVRFTKVDSSKNMHTVISSKPLTRATSGSAGFDITSHKDYVLKPGTIQLIDTDLFLTLPNFIEGQIRSRSGLTLKGIRVSNSPGTIDWDYREEVKIILENVSDEEFTIAKGDRIAQIVFNRVCVPDIIINNNQSDNNIVKLSSESSQSRSSFKKPRDNYSHGNSRSNFRSNKLARDDRNGKSNFRSDKFARDDRNGKSNFRSNKFARDDRNGKSNFRSDKFARDDRNGKSNFRSNKFARDDRNGKSNFRSDKFARDDRNGKSNFRSNKFARDDRNGKSNFRSDKSFKDSNKNTTFPKKRTAGFGSTGIK